MTFRILKRNMALKNNVFFLNYIAKQTRMNKDYLIVILLTITKKLNKKWQIIVASLFFISSQVISYKYNTMCKFFLVPQI